MFGLRDADTNLLRRYPSTVPSQILRIGLLGVTLLAPYTAWAQHAPTASVTIHVTDPIGTPIPGVQIQLVPAPDPASTKLETDLQGNLSLNLKPGGYALVVSDPGFKIWSERIYVAAPDGEATASQLFPVTLKIGAAGFPGIYQKGWLVLNAAYMMDTVGNRSAKKEIAMIKVAAPNMALQVIDWAMQVHGGGGVSEDFPLAAAYAGARTLRFADGPDEVHREQIGKLELSRYRPSVDKPVTAAPKP